MSTYYNGYYSDLLGRALADLAPLIEEAVRVLDKPGTRALRRKIDREFHFVVGCHDILRDGEPSKMPLPSYRRATEVWPGRAGFEARKAREAQPPEAELPAVPSTDDAPAPAFGLRLVVDNAPTKRRASSIASLFPGGAA